MLALNVELVLRPSYDPERSGSNPDEYSESCEKSCDMEHESFVGMPLSGFYYSNYPHQMLALCVGVKLSRTLEMHEPCG
jgi:hypothetical protein